MFDETDVREVAMDLHEAALQPELWQPALARLGGMRRADVARKRHERP
jgi:hypothetical protein